MQSWAADFPFPDVGRTALLAVSDGVDPFYGILDKSVIPVSSRKMSVRAAVKCREKLLESCQAGRSPGPFAECLIVYAQICPMFDIPKNKNDPLCDEIRLISHFSQGGLASVNSLCYSPKLIAFHCRPMHIRDRIAVCGQGAVCYACDIPKCFKRQRVHPRILRLFVYKVVTPSHGTEFFVDRSTPFGWTPSEWSWQCILAVLMWRFRAIGLTDLLAYVDNFFDIQPAGSEMMAHETMIDKVFSDAKVDIHERQRGTRFKGLGWIWDTEAMQMICPEDKHRVFSGLIVQWAGAQSLSLFDLERAAGFMQWLGVGFAVGQASIGYVIHDRTVAQAIFARKGGSPRGVMVACCMQTRAA